MTDIDLDAAPPVLAELARALVDLPPIGEWVELAACGPLAGADVWTADDEPDVDELAVAERVCRRCPVRRECGSYAAQAPVYGVWGGRWHDGTHGSQRAA